jgi:hypothetical protein
MKEIKIKEYYTPLMKRLGEEPEYVIKVGDKWVSSPINTLTENKEFRAVFSSREEAEDIKQRWKNLLNQDKKKINTLEGGKFFPKTFFLETKEVSEGISQEPYKYREEKEELMESFRNALESKNWKEGKIRVLNSLKQLDLFIYRSFFQEKDINKDFINEIKKAFKKPFETLMGFYKGIKRTLSESIHRQPFFSQKGFIKHNILKQIYVSFDCRLRKLNKYALILGEEPESDFSLSFLWSSSSEHKRILEWFENFALLLKRYAEYFISTIETKVFKEDYPIVFNHPNCSEEKIKKIEKDLRKVFNSNLI